MTNMNFIMKLSTLYVGNSAVVPPMLYLVAETAYLSGRTVFIQMFCVVHLALATIEVR
jgi:hypothetical protein